MNGTTLAARKHSGGELASDATPAALADTRTHAEV